MHELTDKFAHLRELIRSTGSALVAFSGGVDSATVLAAAREQLGEGRVLACIGVSPSYPRRELEQAIAFCASLQVAHRLVPTAEHHDRHYLANAADRCFFCKSDLHARLRSIADAESWSSVLDGNHLDDLEDHRHGLAAARANGVRSPLLEAGMRKPEVRALARAMGLGVWDKPAMACLASRVPAGTAITQDLLEQIEAAEDVLAEMGFRQFRVRHHGEIARIELPAEDLARALALREELVRRIRAAGYRFVTLDLAGFRNESIIEQTVPLTIHASA